MTDHKGANGGAGLAEGSHQQIDIPDDAILLRLTETLWSIQANGMGFVYIEKTVIGILYIHQATQVGFIAIHTEN